MNLFLLGAGFDIDATREAGPVYGNSIYIGHHKIDCSWWAEDIRKNAPSTGSERGSVLGNFYLHLSARPLEHLWNC